MSGNAALLDAVLATANQLHGLVELRKDPTRDVLGSVFREFCRRRKDLETLGRVEKIVLERVRGRCATANPAVELLSWLITLGETLKAAAAAGGRGTESPPVGLIQQGVRVIGTFLIVYDHIMRSQMAFARENKRTILQLENRLVGCADRLGEWFLPLLRRYRTAYPRNFEAGLRDLATYIDDSCLRIRKELLKLP